MEFRETTFVEDLAKVFEVHGPWDKAGVVGLCEAIYAEEGMDEGGIGAEVFVSTMTNVWHLIPLEDIRALRALRTEKGPASYLNMLSQVTPRELDTLPRESFHDCLSHMDVQMLADLLCDNLIKVTPKVPDAKLKQVTKLMVNLVGALKDLPKPTPYDRLVVPRPPISREPSSESDEDSSSFG